VTFFSNFLGRGLQERSERFYLGGCVALALMYGTAIAGFEVLDRPVSDTFYAHRGSVRLKMVQANPVEIGKPFALMMHMAVSKHVALLSGWSALESWGVWSDGPSASFAIDLPDQRDGALQLALDCAVMLDPGGAQTVIVDVNGKAAARWDLRTAAAVLRIPISNAIVPASGLVTVVLHILHPSVAPGGADERALGVGIRSLTVLEDQPAH
jgi:hypothetical protein